MIAQQLLRLIQQLAFVFRASRFVTPPQLPQYLFPCRLTDHFIHSGHGNPTSGTTYPSDRLSAPPKVTKLLAQFVVITAETWDVRPKLLSGMLHQPFGWFGLICVVGGITGIFTGLRTGRELRALLGSSAFIAGLMIAGAAGVFQVMLHSTLAPEDSLSAYQNAAASHGLAIALVWWPLALIFAVTYFLFIYRHYAGKVRPREDNQNPY